MIGIDRVTTPTEALRSLYRHANRECGGKNQQPFSPATQRTLKSMNLTSENLASQNVFQGQDQAVIDKAKEILNRVLIKEKKPVDENNQPIDTGNPKPATKSKVRLYAWGVGALLLASITAVAAYNFRGRISDQYKAWFVKN